MKTMKTCGTCRADKPLGEFHRHSGTKDGRQSVCKACKIIYMKAWNKKHPEAQRRYQKKNNRTEHRRLWMAAYMKAYRIRKGEALLVKTREWRRNWYRRHKEQK